MQNSVFSFISLDVVLEIKGVVVDVFCVDFVLYC